MRDGWERYRPTFGARVQRLPDLWRAVLAFAAGLVLAGALAPPAAADHPEYAPTPFSVGQMGEDLCSYHYTRGQASWPAVHDPERPSVRIEGVGEIPPPPPGVCLQVEPYKRHIKFTGHVHDWPAVEHVEPFDRPDEGSPYRWTRFDYAFSLTAPGGAPIEYVTVAICIVPGEGGHPHERCGPPVLVEPGGGASSPEG